MTYKLYVKNYQSIPLGLLISKYPCTIISNLIYYVQGVKGESLFLFCHWVCQEKCVSIFKYLLTLSEVAYLKQINLTDTPKARQLYFRVSWLICYRHFVLETDVLINAVPEQIIDHELIQYHRPVRNIAGCPLLL